MSSKNVNANEVLDQESVKARKATMTVMKKQALIWAWLPLITLVVTAGFSSDGRPDFSFVSLGFFVVYGFILWREWNFCMEFERNYMAGFQKSESQTA